MKKYFWIFSKKVLTNKIRCDIISFVPAMTIVADYITNEASLMPNSIECWCGSMAEQLICNQQVDGSTPFTSSSDIRRRFAADIINNMGAFPSGQRGQTVNLLAMPSMVRIHLPPPSKKSIRKGGFFV